MKLAGAMSASSGAGAKQAAGLPSWDCFPLLILMTPLLTENKTYSRASLLLLAQGLGVVLALTGALGQAPGDVLELVMMWGQSLEASVRVLGRGLGAIEGFGAEYIGGLGSCRELVWGGGALLGL